MPPIRPFPGRTARPAPDTPEAEPGCAKCKRVLYGKNCRFGNKKMMLLAGLSSPPVLQAKACDMAQIAPVLVEEERQRPREIASQQTVHQ